MLEQDFGSHISHKVQTLTSPSGPLKKQTLKTHSLTISVEKFEVKLSDPAISLPSIPSMLKQLLEKFEVKLSDPAMKGSDK